MRRFVQNNPLTCQYSLIIFSIQSEGWPTRSISPDSQQKRPEQRASQYLCVGYDGQMERITFLPVSAAATLAPVVPTFPNTLASSMAAALAMVRPTKWIRRKCTMRATVARQSVVAEVPFSVFGIGLTLCDLGHLESIGQLPLRA